MSAINNFFAQLTGGSGGGSGGPSSLTGRSEQVREGTGIGVASEGGGTRRGSGNVGRSGRERNGSLSSERFGVPLRGANFTYDSDRDKGRFSTPQCESVATLPDTVARRGLCGQGALVAANSEFLCYTIKSSIRVIHRATGARALLKVDDSPGSGVPQDMSLCKASTDAAAQLACVTSHGDLLIWQFDISSHVSSGGMAAGSAEISTEGRLCVKTCNVQSAKWHPMSYDHLAIICTSSVVFCSLEALVADASKVENSSFYLMYGTDGNLPGALCRRNVDQVTDASFSAWGSMLATAGGSGVVRLWDSTCWSRKPLPAALDCLHSFRPDMHSLPLTRVFVVGADTRHSHGESGPPPVVIVTGQEGNRVIKVWSIPAASLTRQSIEPVAVRHAQATLRPIQTIHLPTAGALLLELDPSKGFLWAGETKEGLLYAIHKNSTRARFDYIRPYSLAHPVQSFVVIDQEPETEYGFDGRDEFASSHGRVTQLVCMQSKHVQIYRIPAGDAMPPSSILEEEADTDSSEDMTKRNDPNDGAANMIDLNAEQTTSFTVTPSGKSLPGDATPTGNTAEHTGSPMQLSTARTPAGDGTAAGAGIMLGDGAGGGGSNRMESDRRDDVGSSTGEGTPEGWEGTAEGDWDQDGTVAVTSVSAAASAPPLAAGGDTVSESSSGAGVGDVTPYASSAQSNASSGAPTSGAILTNAPTLAGGSSTITIASDSTSSPIFASAVAIGSDQESSMGMPAAAPRERAVSTEFRRFLTPQQLHTYEEASEGAAGLDMRAQFGTFESRAGGGDVESGMMGERNETQAEHEDEQSDEEEQSVSVSVSEERQEVGATTTEDASPDGNQAGSTGLFSYGGESTDASIQGGGEGGGGGGGSSISAGGGGTLGGGSGGAAGTGEPSASGSFPSAQGDASGGGLSQASQQLGREADHSAGGSPGENRRHPVSASVDMSTTGEGASQPGTLLSPTAGGEASRDISASANTYRTVPGVAVDHSATQALRHLLMRGGRGQGSTNAGSGGTGSSGPAVSAIPSAPPFGSHDVVTSQSAGTQGGLSASTAASGGPSLSVGLSPPRADAEGAGAGVPRVPASPSPPSSTTRGALTGVTPLAPAPVARPPSPPYISTTRTSTASLVTDDMSAAAASSAAIPEAETKGGGEDGVLKESASASQAAFGDHVANIDTEGLVEAVSARVTADMAESMTRLEASLPQMVAFRCRQVVQEAVAASGDRRGLDEAASAESISNAVDRGLRRNMMETVVNPLAKIIVSTSRQVVADPLQASMATLHGNQQRNTQALAQAAHAGAQAGVQAMNQAQMAAMTAAAARAQAGTVRREVLECTEELGRAVASAAEKPVGIVFRECFEGQLIPRIQAAVQRMFEQINETLTRGLQASPLVNNRAKSLADDVSQVRSRVEGLETGIQDMAAVLGGLGDQLERLCSLNNSLQQTVAQTAAAVEAQGQAQKAMEAADVRRGIEGEAGGQSRGLRDGTTAPPLVVDPREELHHLLLANRLEEAMDKALSASDLPLVLWLCGRLDAAVTPSSLPQHILLCLLQQLGTSDLLEETSLKLQWLQSCGLVVDPSDANIRRHLPSVLSSLRQALSAVMPSIVARGGEDAKVVRMTSHVVNSLALTTGTAGGNVQ